MLQKRLTTTERPEGVDAGTLKLAGTDENTVFKIVDELLNNPEEYQKMSEVPNPYGDGYASRRIVDAILKKFKRIDD